MRTLLAAAALTLATSVQAQHAHDAQQLGSVAFTTSCSAQAQPLVNRGVAWLHSFEYEEAQKSFAQAATADPQCAISHWGVAMSNYHPLWAPPTADEMQRGIRAIERAKTIGARSEREAAYITALEAFYGSADRRDYRERTLSYLTAMEQLYRRYPSDQEGAVFYALALIAAGTMDDDPHYVRERTAARILDDVLARAPNHPGVAHYLIHAYDYPQLAQFALPAARRYASIAPASAHAQHMPSHIFTRLGLWQEAIRSNLAAEAAARAYAVRHAMPGAWDEQLHAMDYLVYAYLQLAQDDKARAVLDALARITRVDPPNLKVAYAFSAIPARFALERRRWDEAAALTLPAGAVGAVPWPRFRWAEAHIHFARAVGAARSGKIAVAREAVASLDAIHRVLPASPGDYDWRQQVAIQRQIAGAWLAASEQRPADALVQMRAAADLDDATEKHPVTPGAILPAREQLGELLLDLNRPAEALRAFETSLHRAPGRFTALYGAARAADRARDRVKARRYLAALQRLCQNTTCLRPEIAKMRLSFAP